MNKFLAIILLCSLSSCFLLEQYERDLDRTDNPFDEVEEITSKEDYIEDSVITYLQRQFKDNYTGYTFGSIFINKPKEIIELEQLYELRNSLPSMSNYYGNKLDSMTIATDGNIKSKKQEIKDKKVFPTYDINHVYTVKFGDTLYKMYESKFELYPNKKMKDIRLVFNTELTKEENELFRHFIYQEPLITKEYSTLINESLYERYNSALAAANEEDKETLFKTTLQKVKFYLKFNGFDSDAFTSQVINDNIAILNSNATITKISKLKNILDDKITIGYEKFALYSEPDSLGNGIIKAIYCEFDLNHVLRGTLPVEENFEQYFTE